MELTQQQKEAVQEINRNLRIIACAGSGKTQVITERIRYILDHDSTITPDNIVAFTFTNDAANNMRERLEKQNPDLDLSNMFIGTIHQYCYHILKDYLQEYSDYNILDNVKTHLFIYRYRKKCSAYIEKLNPKNRQFASIFSNCIAKLADNYSDRDSWPENYKNMFDYYRQLLSDHKYLDFNMLLFEALNEMKFNSELREQLKAIRYLIVDEYQDVDDLQADLIYEFSRLGANICVVGDDDQTIYQFRGSQAANMIKFSERFQNVHDVHLDINFRSNAGIVDIADTVISHNKERLSKQMKSFDVNCEGVYKAERSDDQVSEFKQIARIVLKQLENLPANEIAILCRSNKTCSKVSHQLIRNGIPCKIDNSDNFFGGDYYPRFLITLNNMNGFSAEEIKTAWGGLFDERKLRKSFRVLRSASSTKSSLNDILKQFLEMNDFFDPNVEDFELRNGAYSGISTIIEDFETIFGDYGFESKLRELTDFLEYHAEEEYAYHSFSAVNNDNNYVRVMTVHKSKGLEFTTVILPEMMNGIFPNTRSYGQQWYHILEEFQHLKSKYIPSIEDERKLFYVAVTRAKKNLFILYDLSKKDLSTFVEEASTSKYLQIDIDDLYFEREKTNDQSNIQNSRDEHRKEVSAEEYEYMIGLLRDQIIENYSGAPPMIAITKITEVESMTDDEIQREAVKLGLAHWI